MYLPKPPQSPLGFCSSLQGSLLASTLNAWKFILCNIQGYLFNTEVPSHHSLTWVVPNGFSLLLDKTCTPDKCLQPCLPAPYLTPYNPHTPAFSPVPQKHPGHILLKLVLIHTFCLDPLSPQPFTRCTPLFRPLSKWSSLKGIHNTSIEKQPFYLASDSIAFPHFILLHKMHHSLKSAHCQLLTY